MQTIAWTRQIVLGSAYALMGLSSSTPALAETHQTQVIYGDDNRRDVFHEDNSTLMKELSRSTAIMLPKAVLRAGFDQASNKIKLRTRSFGQTFGLCEDEPFREQPLAGFCSSFLVAPDIMVTAGHCVPDASACRTAAFVFDYAYSQHGDDPTVVNADHAYTCKEIIKVELDHKNGNDFAVIRLDRPVNDREPLTVRTTGKLDQNSELTVIGNPSGMPTKIAAGAQVRDNQGSTSFVANLDTYQGNSGSAVFSSLDGTVEGILVRGENDFDTDANLQCKKSKRCENDSCSGETVIRATEFSRYIN